MEITLRKANAIVLELNQIAQAISPRADYELNIHDDDVTGQVNAALEKFTSELTEKAAAVDVYYSIRQKIGTANATVGITDVVGKLAHVEASLRVFQHFANDTRRQKKTAVLLNELAAAKSKEVDQWGSRRTVGDTLLTDEIVENLKKQVNELSRTKRELKDKLLELNVENKISLSEIEEQILRRYGLI